MTQFKIFGKFQKKAAAWASSHYINLAVFNVILVILVLLHSAEYFDPYWLISINIIVFASLVFSVFILGAGSRILFLISLLFFISAGGMKILGVNIWAERIGIYCFQSFFIGVFLLCIRKK